MPRNRENSQEIKGEDASLHFKRVPGYTSIQDNWAEISLI